MKIDLLYSPEEDLHNLPVPLATCRGPKVIASKVAENFDQILSFPKLLTPKNITLAHSKSYLNDVFDQPFVSLTNSYDRPFEGSLTEARNVVSRHFNQVQGTFFSAKTSLEKKQIVFHLAGGMHHGMPDRPWGFCLFNDVAVSLLNLKKSHPRLKTLIIDVDAHFGDGNHFFFKEDENTTLIDLHQSEQWPFPQKQKGGLVSPSGEKYLETLCSLLEEVSERKYDLCFVLLGLDVWEKDLLESSSGINLNADDILLRDLMIYEFLRKKELPATFLTAGGYHPENWKLIEAFLEAIHSDSD